MKHAENNFQAFIPIKPSMVYSRDIFDHSMTDQRCSLDKVILTPDIITAYDSCLPNNIHSKLELHRYVSFLQVDPPLELCCLGRSPTVSPISSNTSSFVRADSGKHNTFLDLAHVCQWGLSCKRREQCWLWPAPSTFAAPKGGKRARNWLEDPGQRFLNSEFGRQMGEEWILQYCVLRCIYS